MEADFSGYATKNGVKCSDGRTILAGAFKNQDKATVPLVWMHRHNEPANVLGHAVLENRPDGVYTKAYFNDTDSGKRAKLLVKHGDVTSLSIYANDLIEQSRNVQHGVIREVSLVIAGANPEARIENVNLQHSDGEIVELDNEAIIYPNEEWIQHNTGLEDEPTEDEPTDEDEEEPEEDEEENEEEGDDEEETDSDEDDDEDLEHAAIIDSLSDEQAAGIRQMVDVALGNSTESLAHADDLLESLDEDQSAFVHDLLQDALAHAATTKGAPVATATKTAPAASDGKTVKDVFDSLTDEQKQVVYFMIGQAVDDATGSSDSSSTTAAHSGTDNEEGTLMGRNVFDQTDTDAQKGKKGANLSHSQMREIMEDAVSRGSLKKAAKAYIESNSLQHATGEAGVDYGVTDIEYLFPDAKTVGDMPNVISRQADWVTVVLNGVKAVPFARIKSISADLTPEQARAKGYIKGNQKVDEVIGLLRRTTAPTTIYKKQRLDRDDILDITDFDLVTWLKWEIRFMLNEEVARAILIGDGRSVGDDDKVKDPIGQIDGIGIRSIANENDLFAIQVPLAANVADGDLIKAMVRARTQYKGTGTPTFFTTDSLLTDLLLLEDGFGRRLYNNTDDLASALRVSAIVPVEVMEEEPSLLGIVVNLSDYSVGTNQGGEVTYFDDFDIDFNQNKYLMETRLSGALTKPKSALVFTRNTGTPSTVTAPSFNGATNTITIPSNATGTEYLIDGNVVTGNQVITHDTTVTAQATDGHYIPNNTTTAWTYTYTAPSGS